ncbi:MAG: cupin domain-containing protein [Chloroflexi bacterium]|nr:cupin domain-containing protein [Chloroflexota bacterium]
MTTAVNLKALRRFDSQRFVSQLIHDSEKARVALFCLEPGQEVPPHSASSEVVFMVVEGKGQVVVGNDQVAVEAGSLVVGPPLVPHGLKAEERLVVVAVIAPRPG